MPGASYGSKCWHHSSGWSRGCGSSELWMHLRAIPSAPQESLGWALALCALGAVLPLCPLFLVLCCTSGLPGRLPTAPFASLCPCSDTTGSGGLELQGQAWQCWVLVPAGPGPGPAPPPHSGLSMEHREGSAPAPGWTLHEGRHQVAAGKGLQPLGRNSPGSHQAFGLGGVPPAPLAMLQGKEA